MKIVLQPKEFPECLSGTRVILKRHDFSDAPLIFHNVNEERGRLREFLPWVDFTHGVEDSIKYIERTNKEWQELNTFDYSLFRKKDSVHLGNIGVHSIDWVHEQVEIGYLLWQSFEGQGYVSEAIQVLEQTAFRMGFYRIEIRCDPTNIRSSAVALRNRYTQEGLLRKNTLHGQRRRDTLIFSKLRPEAGPDLSFAPKLG